MHRGRDRQGERSVGCSGAAPWGLTLVASKPHGAVVRAQSHPGKMGILKKLCNQLGPRMSTPGARCGGPGDRGPSVEGECGGPEDRVPGEKGACMRQAVVGGMRADGYAVANPLLGDKAVGRRHGEWACRC